MQASPYTPGEIASSVPGRSSQLGEFEERLSYLVDLNRLVGRIRVELAPRGFGKTSLLRQYQRRATERGVLTIWVTAGEASGLIAQLIQALRHATATWSTSKRAKLLKLLDAVTISVGVPGIAKAEARIAAGSAATAPTGVREFEEIIRMAAREGTSAGLVIFIDEIQAADADGLRTLAYAWQHLQAEGGGVPAAVFASGLPDAPDKISAVVTFAERIAYRQLGPLNAEAEQIALSAPARSLGVTWNPDAVAAAVDVAGGYPYSVQLIADASWAAAGRPDPGGVITLNDVHNGREAMRDDLEALFRARWANAAAHERELMTVMAELGDGPVERSVVAERMGVTVSSLSVPRARLIDKGFIQPRGRGLLEFTVPGFSAFIRDLDQ